MEHSGHVVPPSGGIFRLKPVLHASNLICIVIAVLVIRDLRLLFAFPIAVGTDGYYYVNQISSLSATGSLYYPNAYPLALGLLVPLSITLGDPVVAIKIGAMLLLAALAFGVYAFTREVTGNTVAGVTAAGLIYSSNSHLYFISEFISNLAALAFLVWGVFFLRRKSGDKSPHSKLVSALLVVCAIASHRSSLVIIACIALTVLLLLAISSFSHKLTVLTIAVLIAALWTVAWFVHGRTTRLENPFQGPATFELVVLCIAALYCLFSTDRIAQIAGVLAFAVTLNPFLDRATSLDSIGGRLSLLAHVQIAVMLPILIVRTVSHPRQINIVCIVVVLAFTFVNLSRPIPRGLEADFLLRRSILIKGLQKLSPSVPIGSFIVAPHGDQFIVTHILGVAAQNRIAANTDSHAQWLIRRLPGTLTGFDLLPVTDEGRLRYALISQTELERMLAILPAKDRLLLAAANPHLRSD